MKNKGILYKNEEDHWFVINTSSKKADKSILPILPDDEIEFGNQFIEGQIINYEIFDYYEGEKIPWYFAKLIL